MRDQRTIAVYYPYFGGGGAEAVCLWMLEALAHKYELTLVTLGPINLQKLNKAYGTNLSPETLNFQYVLPQVFSLPVNFIVANNKYARGIVLHLVIRYFKQICDRYDLVISAYNAADLGKAGIQYIHNPKVIEGKFNWISEFSDTNVRQNYSLANSKQIAAAIRTAYDLESEIIYPPVVLRGESRPWSEKKNSFICSGRLVSSKAPHRVIRILQLVRKLGFTDITLNITGGGDAIYASQYLRFLRQQVKANADWVQLHEGLSYQAYSELLYQCRYGIHFKREPFGISIAEMVKAGAIPFVRNQGGQLEIINYIEALMFKDEQEAAEKIAQVLENKDLQLDLIEQLESQKELFSTTRFSNEVQTVVERYLNLN